MFVCLSGLLNKVECNQDERYAINEFLQNYSEAKIAFEKNDFETVKQFFEIYLINK